MLWKLVEKLRVKIRIRPNKVGDAFSALSSLVRWCECLVTKLSRYIREKSSKKKKSPRMTDITEDTTTLIWQIQIFHNYSFGANSRGNLLIYYVFIHDTYFYYDTIISRPLTVDVSYILKITHILPTFDVVIMSHFIWLNQQRT